MKNFVKLGIVAAATTAGDSPPFGIAPTKFKVMLSNGAIQTLTVRRLEHKSSNTSPRRGHWGILPNSDIYECSVAGANVCQYNQTHFMHNGNLFIVNPDRTTSLVPHPPEEPKPESLATSAKSHFSTSTAVKPLSATPSPTNPPKENKPYGEPSSTPVKVEGPANPLKTPLWSLASIPLIVLTAYACYRNRKRGQLLDGSNREEIEMGISGVLGFEPLPLTDRQQRAHDNDIISNNTSITQTADVLSNIPKSENPYYLHPDNDRNAATHNFNFTPDGTQLGWVRAAKNQLINIAESVSVPNAPQQPLPSVPPLTDLFSINIGVPYIRGSDSPSNSPPASPLSSISVSPSNSPRSDVAPVAVESRSPSRTPPPLPPTISSVLPLQGVDVSPGLRLITTSAPAPATEQQSSQQVQQAQQQTLSAQLVYAPPQPQIISSSPQQRFPGLVAAEQQPPQRTQQREAVVAVASADLVFHRP